MVLVVAGGVALATALAAPRPAGSGGQARSALELAHAAHAPHLALRAHSRVTVVKIIAAMSPASPPVLLTASRRLELAPDGVVEALHSCSPRASRGPPTA
jgi:hypothetical protein